MGTYVYKVTKQKKEMEDGEVANVMEFAYKPYSGDYKANSKMAFGSQCWRADKYVKTQDFTGKVTLSGDEYYSTVWVNFPSEQIQDGDGTLTDDEFATLARLKVVETVVQIYRQDLSNIDSQRKLLSESRDFIDLQQTHVANIIVEHSEDDLLSEVLESAWKSTENENYDQYSQGWVSGDHVTWTSSVVGQRSNMPGDHFFIKGTLFRVAPTGFEQLCVDGMRMSWHEPDYIKLAELK